MPCLIRTLWYLILLDLLYHDFWALTDWALGPRFYKISFNVMGPGFFLLLLLRTERRYLDSPRPACYWHLVPWILSATLYWDLAGS
jgi:hypothetical protein